MVIPGWGSDAGRSSGLARSLIGAGLDVLLVDLPGHGRTAPAASYDVVRMLEDIEASRRWTMLHFEVSGASLEDVFVEVLKKGRP